GFHEAALMAQKAHRYVYPEKKLVASLLRAHHEAWAGGGFSTRHHQPAKEVGRGVMWTLDLFGNEISINAANAFHAGLKGRYREDRLKDIISSKAAPIRCSA
ncbi:MAG: hypothetical protein WBQ54_16005, partial [Pseudolabrys sp.]